MPNRNRSFQINPIRRRICAADETLNYAFDHLQTHFPPIHDFMARLYSTAGADYTAECDKALCAGLNAYAQMLLDGETAHWPYQRLIRFMQGVHQQLQVELPILCCVDYVTTGTLPGMGMGIGIEPSLIPLSLQNVILEFTHGKISNDHQYPLALAPRR